MAKSRILDADGNPIELAVLTEVHARASLTGVRQVWGQTAATGLTPAGLASLLQAAADGSPNDYLTLAEEMEERDPHYASVLRTRKLAVIGLEPVVEAAGDDAKSQAQAEAVRTLIANPHFETLLEDALDGLGKGYSANEIMWDKGSTWTPKHYEWRDPRWFSWDRITRQQLRLLTEANPSEGEALAPYKFVVHRPKLKSGLPVRAGLARIVAFCWICKAYALKDWMAFIEVFGMPLRLGRYGPGAKPEDIAVLRTAVASIGTDAAAVLPTSMAIEFQKAGEGGGNSADLYLKLCEYLDKQVSKAVLGQTSSSDSQASGLSNGNNQGHNEVRADLLKADAKQLATTINRDLIIPFITLNFGVQANYPRFTLPVLEPEDVTALVGNVAKLVPLGLKVGMSTIRDKIGIPDPDKDEELLGMPAASPGNELQEKLPPAKKPVPAANAAQPPAAAPRDAADDIADRLEELGTAAATALVSPLQRLVASADSLEAIRDGLDTLYPDLPEAELARLLRESMATAWLTGRFDVQAGL